MARLAEKPDLALLAVVAELVGRGVPASYGAVWRLLKAEVNCTLFRPATGDSRRA